MLQSITDPLLSVTQGLLRIAYVVLFAVAALLGIAACVALVGGDLISRLPDTVPVARGAGIVLTLASIPSLAIFGWFLLTLRQIVRTVTSGMPFVGENADRLTRMGWMALALKAVLIIERLVLGDQYGIEEFSLPGGGVVLALTLFVLARVFRQGAAMRDDLEGTV